jgi:NADH:ubiquinone reductase (non-electrogenic)
MDMRWQPPARLKAIKSAAPQQTTAPRICILGGGFGGLYCALALPKYLKRLPHGATVTLVEPQERFLFTPLLYELLTEELMPWEISPSYAQLLGHTGINILHDWAERIDPHHQKVELRCGEPLAYDYLVVALGSQMRTPNIKGGDAHALPFANLAHEWQLEERLARLEQEKSDISVMLIGAGPNGVELACKLADRLGPKGHITVIDRRGVILRPHPEPVRKAAARAFRKRGIIFHANVAIEEITANTVVYQCRGETYSPPVDLVLWTIGTIPHPWLGELPLATSKFGQYILQPTLQLPNYPNIFVLGDMGQMPAPGRDRAPMTAQSAFQAAPVVAHNLWASIQNRPLRRFTYHHLGEMLTLGRGEAVVNGFGLCLTGRLGGFSRRWAYWLRLPTLYHRWQVLKQRFKSFWGRGKGRRMKAEG